MQQEGPGKFFQQNKESFSDQEVKIEIISFTSIRFVFIKVIRPF